MRQSIASTILIFVAVALADLSGCSAEPAKELLGTWKGTTKIDQEITITIRKDSTIEIETVADSVRDIRKGTYQVIDRRLRIALTVRETQSGDLVKREPKFDQEEALFTFTAANEMVLREGTQAIILERIKGPD